MLKGVKNSEESNLSGSAVEEMYEFKRGLMNWGSEELILDFLRYEESIAEAASVGAPAILKVGDEFLKCIRRELGFEDKGSVNLMSVILTSEARRSAL